MVVSIGRDVIKLVTFDFGGHRVVRLAAGFLFGVFSAVISRCEWPPVGAVPHLYHVALRGYPEHDALNGSSL